MRLPARPRPRTPVSALSALEDHLAAQPLDWHLVCDTAFECGWSVTATLVTDPRPHGEADRSETYYAAGGSVDEASACVLDALLGRPR